MYFFSINLIIITEACGVVSLVYGLLLHDGGRSNYLNSPSSSSECSPDSLSPPSLSPLHQGTLNKSPEPAPAKLKPQIETITLSAMSLVKSIAVLDLKAS